MITNYEDFATGRKYKRIRKTGIIGSGPHVAANNFRNFSFVSGIILDTVKAKKHATSKWDESEMYQMFVGCRIIAECAPLLGIDRVTVRKEIQIPGEQVDSYALKPRLDPCPIKERHIPLNVMGRLVADAIEPYLNPPQRQKIVEKIILQILLFTYPFWIFEYRRVQSWKYAAGICLGMRPRNTFRGLGLSFGSSLRLTIVYGIISLLGLTTPLCVFDMLYPALYSFAKSYSHGDA